jgi:predicted dehydrogenase
VTRLRVGVLGAGLIAQIEHVPNLLRLRERFEVVRVADPSAAARAFMRERFGLPGCEGLEQLLGERLDALLVASPDFTHVEAVLQGLGAGLHVFSEKPLCYGPAEADRILAARERAGRVVQVGYMKRFDPSYELALGSLPGDAARLRYVSVEVNEADPGYHMSHHPSRRGDDVPPALLAAGRAETERQVAAALGGAVDPLTFRGFTTAYCSSLVHEVNAVHGIFERLGIEDVEVVGAEVFAGGDGGSGTARFNGGDGLWQMMHLLVPGLADYKERIALYWDDAVLELVFPSPYLNHQQTELVVHTSQGPRYERRLLRHGYEEAYLRELEGFWAAVVEGAPQRNTVEQARRDQALLCELGRLAARPPVARPGRAARA